jgi:predicted DCC family thiol-disulfide oxidoreductase YuxK
MDTDANQSIIFYDDSCRLCNKWIFIVRKNNRYFQIVPLRQYSGEILSNSRNSETNFNSLIFFDKGKRYYKSDAVLHLTRRLKGLWPLLYVLILVPATFRNRLYDLVADNRYRWFGRVPTCNIQNNNYMK